MRCYTTCEVGTDETGVAITSKFLRSGRNNEHNAAIILVPLYLPNTATFIIEGVKSVVRISAHNTTTIVITILAQLLIFS